MKNNNKKTLKGFTLVELIVVVAVFGILIAATLTLITPSKRIFDNTREYAASAGMVDNVRRVLEDNLRYANRMDVYAGPDVSSGESAFMQASVNNLREKFLLGTTDKERITYGDDIVYVMKINNPEPSQFKNGLASTDEKAGKISIWRYDAGSLNAASSKEWAVSEAVFGDYSFSLSFGVDLTTSSQFIAGRERFFITDAAYKSFGSFVSPANFSMKLDIYENEYADRANKASSRYNLCKTTVSNTVALSFINMATSTTLKKEQINYINKPAGAVTTSVEAIEPERYTYTSGANSSDIYFVYTIPDLT